MTRHQFLFQNQTCYTPLHYLCRETLLLAFLPFPCFLSTHQLNLDFVLFQILCFSCSVILKALCKISFRERWWSSKLLPQFSRAFLRLEINLTGWKTESSRVPSCFPMHSVKAAPVTHGGAEFGARMSVYCCVAEQHCAGTLGPLLLRIISPQI